MSVEPLAKIAKFFSDDAGRVYRVDGSLSRLDEQRNALWSVSVVEDGLPAGVTEPVTSVSFARNGDVLVAKERRRTTSKPDVFPIAQYTEHATVLRFDAQGALVKEYRIDYDDSLLGEAKLRPFTHVFETVEGEIDAWGSLGFSLDGTPLAEGDWGASKALRVRFGSDGAPISALHFGDSDYDNVQAITQSEAGSAFVLLETQPHAASGFVPTRGQVLAVGADGNVLWEKDLGSEVTPRLTAMVDGSVLVVGIDNSAEPSLFIGRFDPTNGESIVWKTHVLDSDAHANFAPWELTHLVPLPDGDFLIGGRMFDGWSAGGPALATGGEGTFFARYSSDGAYVWSTLFCSTWNVWLNDLGYWWGAPRAVLAYEGELELGSTRLRSDGHDYPLRAYTLVTLGDES